MESSSFFFLQSFVNSIFHYFNLLLTFGVILYIVSRFKGIGVFMAASGFCIYVLSWIAGLYLDYGSFYLGHQDSPPIYSGINSIISYLGYTIIFLGIFKLIHQHLPLLSEANSVKEPSH